MSDSLPNAETLDAENLYTDLRTGVQQLLACRANSLLVGIRSGGAWLAERLQKDLNLEAGHIGVISSALHRDDFQSRGLSAGPDPTKLPFDVEDRHIVLVDDVLYTGRTIRAVINELFDFGRPASVTLAVLVDRSGRELPIEAAYAATRIALPAHQRLSLTHDAKAQGGAVGRFSFDRT
jgi:pyrimidine operon attenuation protein / uracil phosphoribosyltransferase